MEIEVLVSVLVTQLTLGMNDIHSIWESIFLTCASCRFFVFVGGLIPGGSVLIFTLELLEVKGNYVK